MLIHLLVRDSSLGPNTLLNVMNHCRKWGVRLGPSKTGLSSPPPVIYITDCSKAMLLFVLCFGDEFLCCLNLMYVFIVLVKFG